MHATGEGGSFSLDEYLASGRFPINYFRYTDCSGRKIIVDRILRYENLLAEHLFGDIYLERKGWSQIWIHLVRQSTATPLHSSAGPYSQREGDG